MSRRSDTSLRKSINTIEELLLVKPQKERVLEQCLGQLLLLLDAEFGYAFRCKDADITGIPWEMIACKQVVDGELLDFPNSNTSFYLPEYDHAQFQLGKVQYTNELPFEHPLSLPHNHPNISNSLCIPLADARYIHGVLYLCNRPEGFSDDIVKRLRPFLAAANCVLRAASKNNTQQVTDNVAYLATPATFFNTLDSFFNAVFFVDSQNQVTSCNRAATKMIGLARRDIVGSPMSRFLVKGVPRDAYRQEKLDNHHTQFQEGSMNMNALWRGVSVMTASGTRVLVDLAAFELKVGKETLRGLVMDDISERMKSAQDYQSVLQRFEVLTSLAPVGILQIDRNWECTYSNDKWCEFTQTTPDEARGIGWMNSIHPEEAEEILLDLRDRTARFGTYEEEFRLKTPLGRITWVQANAMTLYDEFGQVFGLIMTFSDISAHRRNEQRLEEIARTDQLTGLVNRTFFNDRIEQALKGVARYGAIAVMFIDLDDFKHINDSLGHDTGDALLQEVSTRLKDTLRDVDTIARIGGDEFTVILTHVNHPTAVSSVADKLLKSMTRPYEVNERKLFVTCSIGIAYANESGMESKVLLKQADIALYKAKEAGRNQFRHYTSDLDREVIYHIHLRNSLRDPKRSDFYIHYQPQADADNQKLVGFEALCRWQHEEVAAIGPEKFVGMIEQFGMVNEFSNLIFDQIFSELKTWRENDPEFETLKISINLSAKQFRNRELASNIHNRCVTFGIKPQNIVLEITETALIDDPELAFKTIDKLKRWGFGISLDDFGTGYSSLAYMRKLPLDSVKIDKSFITDLDKNEEDAKIVLAIIHLSESLGLKVIAEGVETEQISLWLSQNGCFLQQGYLFGKPMPVNEAKQLQLYSVYDRNAGNIAE